MLTSIGLFFIVDTIKHFPYSINQYNAYYIKSPNLRQRIFIKLTL